MCGSEAVCDDVCVFATECHFVQLSVNVTECVSVYVAVQVWAYVCICQCAFFGERLGRLCVRRPVTTSRNVFWECLSLFLASVRVGSWVCMCQCVISGVVEQE